MKQVLLRAASEEHLISKDFEYPYAENFNQRGTQIPMMLLAQINFEEAPKFENFPEKGILQIFINPTDDLYGADFDNPTVQKIIKSSITLMLTKTPKISRKHLLSRIILMKVRVMRFILQ